MAIVLKLSGKTSILKKRLHHGIKTSYPLNLNVGVVGFYSTYLTPNITEKNNVLQYEDHKLVVPPGQYSLKNLEEFIRQEDPSFNNETFILIADKARNRVKLRSPFDLSLNIPNSLGDVLGFTKAKLSPGELYEGDILPKFHPFDTINIHCNLAKGMLVKDDEHNHKETDIIATFRTNAEFRQPIKYEPTYPLFFPIQCDTIEKIEVTIRDDKHKLIDFDGAQTTVLLQIK